MEKYEINSNTLALIPDGRAKTIVYETNRTFTINKRINKVMDESCRYYGSTIKGRQEGTTALTGVKYKAPVIVSEDKNIIFFPTTSPRLSECSWISLNNINNIQEKDYKMKVNFLSGRSIYLNISENVLKNQIYRSTLLESTIRKRQNK